MATHYIPPPRPCRNLDEGVLHFGTRILVFLLGSTEPDFLIGFFADDELEHAHYACHHALATSINLGDKDHPLPSPVCIYDQVENIRRLITAALKRRKNQRECVLATFMESVYPKGGAMPGPRIRVSDITPKPTMPPTGELVDAYPRPTAESRLLTTPDIDDPF